MKEEGLKSYIPKCSRYIINNSKSMSLQHYAIEITYLLIGKAYQIVFIKVKLKICLVLSGKAL